MGSLDVRLVAIDTQDVLARQGVSMQQISHPSPGHTDLAPKFSRFTNGTVLRSRKEDRKTGPVSITTYTKRSPELSKKWSSFGGRVRFANWFGGLASDQPGNCTLGANGFGLDGAAMRTPSTLKTLHPSLRRGVDFIWDKLVQSSLTQELASPGVILG